MGLEIKRKPEKMRYSKVKNHNGLKKTVISFSFWLHGSEGKTWGTALSNIKSIVFIFDLNKQLLEMMYGL